MPNIRETIINFASSGMNESVHPGLLDAGMVSRMTNCRIEDQLPTTRFGARAHALGDDAKEFRSGNIQGACFYNPILGHSQSSFGPDLGSIVVSVAGRKYHITLGESDVVSISDETGDVPGVSTVHLAWLYQAENFVICQNGISDTWIWDGQSDAFLSKGYNADKPEVSELANAATCGAYAHGRIVQVVDGKKVIVGDIIHKYNLTNPSNILKTSEQIYYATGSFFSPPSNMGEVVAIGILPLHNTTHGHEDVIIHCKHGIFSLKIDHYPRSDWVAQAISKHLLLDSAAAGPYALALYDGDQFFRSRHGIQSIRSAAAQADQLGNPLAPLSQPVKSWLSTDYPQFLRFASVSKWAYQHRMFCTTGLWADGSHRGGSGILSMNMNPDGNMNQQARSWEGLWTLPPGFPKVIQLVNGLFGGKDRMFMLCSAKDGDEYKNSIAEFDPTLTHDVNEDGSISEISCQVITRLAPREDHISSKRLHDGRITFRNVRGDFKWGVWIRSDEFMPWTLWRSGESCATSTCALSECLHGAQPRHLMMNLGEPPSEAKSGVHFQALIRWRGFAQLECLRMGLEMTDGDDSPTKDQEDCVSIVESCDYNDYEYSTSENRWETH